MRLSVTDLDQLAYYLRTEDMPLADLLRRLRREEPPNEAMRVGTALHSVLEDAGEEELLTIERDGFIFDFTELDVEIALPEIRELKIERDLVDGVTVVGKVDAIQGLTVYDHKTTKRFDPERFMQSLQWKAYLTLLGGEKFIYNVFEIREPTRAMPDNLYRVVAFHEVPLYRYPEMEAEVLEAVRGFQDFATEYLVAA